MLDSFKDVLTKDIELNSVKSALTKDIPMNSVKEVLTKDIEFGNLLEMEDEIKKLKSLLATEVKLKEFLVQEVDIKKMFSTEERMRIKSEVEPQDVETKTIKLPPYNGALVETLQKEQKGILFIYKELMSNAKDRNYAQVEQRLIQFSTVLKTHYAYADKELYAYLKCYIHNRFPKREKAFNELSLEMKNISIEAFFSLTQSPNIPLNDDTYENFINEFILLGDQIKNRVQREETVLFEMYKQSNEAREIS